MRDRPICAIDRWRCTVDGSTICASIDRSRSHRWIAQCYRQSYTGDVKTCADKTVTLREAAQKFHPKNRFLAKRCSCKGSCKTDKCSCRANKVTCSTHCHPNSTCANREESNANVTPCRLLSPKDCLLINGKACLTDQHMRAANELLKTEFVTVSGLEDTVLQQNFSFSVPRDTFVQFLHVDDRHRITISNVGETDNNAVCVYDSIR